MTPEARITALRIESETAADAAYECGDCGPWRDCDCSFHCECGAVSVGRPNGHKH